MQKGEARENKMGLMPIGRLLMDISLPIMISMLIQALYNIVDSMFVAKLSEDAFTAVSMAFPIHNLMIAVATGTGVGINALLSRSLGEGNTERVNQTAMHGLLLMLLSYVPFAIFGVLFSEAFMRSQTDIESIVMYGKQYLSILAGTGVGLFGAIAFERLLQSTGKTVYSMITQIVGAIINIILDPILIFGWCGLPAMGVRGAAIATVFSLFLSMLLGAWFNVRKNHEIQFSLKKFRFEGAIVRRIYEVGLPSIVMTSISSVVVFFMNLILIQFSATATAVMGVYFKLQSFVFMPVYGLNNGLVPIVSYNYGARNKNRVLKSIGAAILTAACIMAAGTLLFEVFPVGLLKMFSASDTMMRLGVPALRIIAVHFILASFSVVMGSVFQALGDGVPSLISSLVRQIVVLLPAAWLLAQTGNLDNVWWCFPIAEVVAAILSALFFVREYRRKIKNLGTREN